jgi:ubiquinone/menaquinone biosynthesis C-methylase UbiE
MKIKDETSWEKSSQWYNKLVGVEGHYYHQNIVVPGVLRLLKLVKGFSVLDIGSGQGILARNIPNGVYYHGIDASPSLIKAAQAQDKNILHKYTVADATKSLPLEKKDFFCATALFSLQNMEHPDKAIKNVAAHLKKGGRFIFVLNHPAFRIPKQSGWGVLEETNEQYRWVSRYMSPLKIPIEMHPGQKNSEKTLSFHHSLSNYSKFLFDADLVIEKIEEWVSDKKNQPGPHAKREDTARNEIPLFMAIVARKL